MDGEGVGHTERRAHGQTVAETLGNVSEHVDGPDQIPVTAHPDTLARVNFGHGVTIALGKMNFDKIDVSVSLPCRPKLEALESTYDFARDWVEQRLQKEIDDSAAKNGGPV